MPQKYCKKCGGMFPEEDFIYRNKKKKIKHNWCKNCRRRYYDENKKAILKVAKLYKELNKKAIIKYKKNWYKKNRERMLQNAKINHQKLRDSILSYYSKGVIKCELCGLTDLKLLEIDHINGGGGKFHQHLLCWIVRNNYPPNFRVLCRNCNWREHLKKFTKINTNVINAFRRKSIALQVYTDGKMNCALCGEEDIDVLVFDHINGGGKEQRKRLNINYPINRWLIKNNYPSGFRVLCQNCNYKIYDTKNSSW